MLEPYERSCAPEAYIEFRSPEERGDLQDLELGDVLCDCWGRIKLRGALRSEVVVECLKCARLWTFDLNPEDEEDDWCDEEEEDA